jgi:hypothetical protein
VARKKLRLESGITGNGHALALAASSASFGVVAAFNQRHSGLQGTRFIRALDEDIANDEGLDRVLAVLQSIHQKILASNRQFLLVGEESRLAGFEQSLQNAWQASTHSAQSPLFQFKPTDKAQDVAWLVNTQVQFCARSFAAVPVTHPDSSALVLLGGVLKNGYLHSAIREKGGAYGSGAGYDAMSGSFRFHSYRDPRLGETLDDFKHSVDWLLNNRHEQRQLDEALLGVISSADKPLSPAGEAKSAFHHALYGRTPEHRRRMRERLLAVSLADIQRVGEKYLTQKGVTAVVAPSTRLSDVEALNLTVERL